MVSRGGRAGISDTWTHQRAWSHRGRRNLANDHTGFPGTWETLPSPSSLPAGARLTNSRLIPGCVLSRWGRTEDETMVSPNEGNEVRRDGRQGVGASRSTAEPGEPPEGPWGGKGTPSYEPWEGNMPGTPRPDPVSTKRQRIAELARNCPDLSFTNLCITSTSNGCTQLMPRHARTEPSAWTDKPRPNTR